MWRLCTFSATPISTTATITRNRRLQRPIIHHMVLITPMEEAQAGSVMASPLLIIWVSYKLGMALMYWHSQAIFDHMISICSSISQYKSTTSLLGAAGRYGRNADGIRLRVSGSWHPTRDRHHSGTHLDFLRQVLRFWVRIWHNSFQIHAGSEFEPDGAGEVVEEDRGNNPSPVPEEPRSNLTSPGKLYFLGSDRQ